MTIADPQPDGKPRPCLSALSAALACTLALSLSCQESPPRGPAAEASASADAVQDAPAELTRAAELEAHYIIGPAAAQRAGYRIDWQARTFPQADSGIAKIALEGDSVFVLDGRNFLTRLGREDGDRVWRIPVAAAVDEILGITYVQPIGKVFLTINGAVLVLDAATGSQVDRQALQKIANTEPLVLGQFLVYGALKGQIIWHSYEVGYEWRGYQVAPSIRLAPRYVDGYLVAAGSDGTIMVLSASYASQLWSRRLLDAIVAQPAVGNGIVYVAGLDQHIWAFDMNTGRRMWRYLTESPLSEPPVLIGERLYQQVPTEGLVCFNAVPLDSPGGEVIWTADATGSVIGQRRDNLLVWDGAARRLALVGAAQGAVRDTLDLPDAHHLLASRLTEGELFAASEDGRVIRALPRN
jgi:outer membrane protein assembly factor BamB